MKKSSFKVVSICLFVASSHAWSTESPSSSRRTFLTSSAAGIVGTGGMLLHPGVACTCAYCCMSINTPPANAYEVRAVGGDDASPETKAMNRQAYETNNRLERDGFKLDTQAEQSASLKAALTTYSYEPSTPPKKDDKRKSK